MFVLNIYNIVRQLICQLQINCLPINPFEIAEFLGFQILSYSQATAQGEGDIIEKLIKCDVSVDAFCYSDNNNHIIFYDDKAHQDRITFTIAHEIAHIILKHRKNNGIFKRYQTHTKKDPIEKEADEFAGELLRPPILLVLLGLTNDYVDIAHICNVSYAAAIVGVKKIKGLKSKIHTTYSDIRNFYQTQFYDYIYSQICDQCNNIIVSKTAKYCPICCNNNLTKMNKHPVIFSYIKQRGREEEMKYKEYYMNECPTCKNEEINASDNFCKICGQRITNYCIGCNNDLALNARYCTECGSETFYFSHGILCYWEKEERGEFDIDDIDF